MSACEVAYEVVGPEGAPVVVLSSSLGTDRSMWDALCGPLSRRLRIIRYDMRGHGASPVPPAPYSIADLGGDVVALLDRLDIDRASLCGVSLGGMISMWVAAHAPERVERLVLCCTSAHMPPPEAWHDRITAVRANGVGAIADAVLERWFTPSFAQANPEMVAGMRELLASTPREGYAGCCEALSEMDLRPDLGSIRAPTLVLSGEDDPSTPPEHGRTIAEGIPGARFSLIAHAAHLACIERAEMVGSMVLGFLDSPKETG